MQRFEDLLLHEAGERLLRCRLDRGADHDEAEVGVAVFGARLEPEIAVDEGGEGVDRFSQCCPNSGPSSPLSLLMPAVWAITCRSVTGHGFFGNSPT